MTRHEETILEAWPDATRIWVYVAHPVLTPAQEAELRPRLAQFCTEWVSHRRDLRATFELLEGRFVILAVDETKAEASGCSIDSSVRFLQGVERAMGITLFDRMRFSYVAADGAATTVDHATFGALYAAGDIQEDTLVYDTLVTTLGALRTGWRKPLRESWHARLV